jgi:hypothetical protein
MEISYSNTPFKFKSMLTFIKKGHLKLSIIIKIYNIYIYIYIYMIFLFQIKLKIINNKSLTIINWSPISLI